MAVRLLLCQGKRMTDKEKAERLAAKLRENLRRRKAQTRDLQDNRQPRAGGDSSPALTDDLNGSHEGLPPSRE